MPTLRFTKGHGTGNDFVVFADRDDQVDLTDAQVAAICDRHFGVGADGILRAVRRDGGWFMDYRNADGSVAEMCGNGIRVFTAFLLEQGLAELPDGGALPIVTRSGVHAVSRSDDGFEAELGLWRVDGGEPLVRAKELAIARPGLGIDVGNPHVVVALASDDELEAIDLAYLPVLDPEPALGANVEFVVPEDPLVEDGVGRIRMRVHERGSGETLSCGTGAAAAALATRYYAGEGAPDRWRVRVPGGTLGVRVAGDQVLLSGPAELVYDGELTV